MFRKVVFPGLYRMRGGYDPFVTLQPYAGFWADDPKWVAPADGATVASWNNRGTFTTDADQATEAAKPIFRASVALLNNKSALEFDGTDDHLDILAGAALAQPFTVVWVGLVGSLASVRRSVGLRTGSGTYGVGYDNTPDWNARMQTNLIGGNPALSTKYITTTTFNGASSDITVNGASVITGNAGTDAINQIVLGAGHTAAVFSNFHFGHTAYVGIYSGTPGTQPLISTVVADLTRYYAI